jgi:chromosomal replication initiation ATPase DnaA
VDKRNPVFLYGPSRSGKTTLLQIIEDYFSRIKGVRVLRLDADDLAIELVNSIKNSGDRKGFYHKFLDYDALLVDNIWVLRGKLRTIEEIFRFFKLFIEKGKFLVMTWDIEPETLSPESKTIKRVHQRSIAFRMKPYNPQKFTGSHANFPPPFTENN